MQPLVMTPQLQLAIRLLAMSLAEIRALLETEAARLGTLRLIGESEDDPFDVMERSEAAEDGRAPWLWSRSSLLDPVPGEPEPDVWVTGTPPVATANGTSPRYTVVPGTPDTLRESLWLLRSIRMRARTFERIAGILSAGNEAFLAGEARHPTRTTITAVAETAGFHTSTIDRVTSAGLIQSRRGLTRFDELIRRRRRTPRPG